MSCCNSDSLATYDAMTPTQQIYAIKAQQPGGGNLASGNTDYVEQQTERGALVRLEATERPIGAGQCCTMPPLVRRAGGTSSGAYLLTRMAELEVCSAQQNLALKKLRGIPGCPPVSTNPQLRFAAYARRSAANLCPDIRTNAGVPHAVDGPCTNVIGIVQTWPPH
jgi:hypothetical protein